LQVGLDDFNKGMREITTVENHANEKSLWLGVIGLCMDKVAQKL